MKNFKIYVSWRKIITWYEENEVEAQQTYDLKGRKCNSTVLFRKKKKQYMNKLLELNYTGRFNLISEKVWQGRNKLNPYKWINK